MFQVNPLQRIHMKNQALFSLKDKSKKLKCRLLQFLFGALRVIMFQSSVATAAAIIFFSPNKTNGITLRSL